MRVVTVKNFSFSTCHAFEDVDDHVCEDMAREEKEVFNRSCHTLLPVDVWNCYKCLVLSTDFHFLKLSFNTSFNFLLKQQ